MYISFIVAAAKQIIEDNGGTVEIDILTQDARDIVNFEIELFNVSIKHKSKT